MYSYLIDFTYIGTLTLTVNPYCIVYNIQFKSGRALFTI